jgi:hypothetical protein
MKAQGIIKGQRIILKKVLTDKKLREGLEVDIIILPLEKGAHRFSTFKLGVKEEYTGREKIYAGS